ncbi:MAG: hypothetical protein WBM13_14280 [Bacteroidia bacterium]
MEKKKIVYPLYRKYAHERTYFKVISDSEWEEIHVLAGKYSIHQFKATILPERNYIYDLTYDYHNNWVAIQPDEYEQVKFKAMSL